MKIQGNGQSQTSTQQQHSSIGQKIGKAAQDIGGAFFDGAVSIAKDAAKEEGKRLAGQAINLAGSIFTK